jgi:hypothetical protein
LHEGLREYKEPKIMSRAFWRIAACYTFLGISLAVGMEGARSLGGELQWMNLILDMVALATVFRLVVNLLPRLPGRLQPPWPDVVGILAVWCAVRAVHYITTVSTDKSHAIGLATSLAVLAASAAVRARKGIAVAPSIGALKHPGA